VHLEYQVPSRHVWLDLENDSDRAVELITLNVTAIWNGHPQELDWPVLNTSIGPRAHERFEVRLHLTAAIRESFPGLLGNQSFELRVVPITDSGSASAAAVFQVSLRDGEISF
jgi:hypothetical protein